MDSRENNNKTRVLLILPCFNEERSVGPLLREIASLGTEYDTLVVDDGSSDDTFTQAAQQSRTVRLPINLGIGGAVQTGIKFAYRHGYELCVQVDGDGQHPPDQIVKLVEAYKQGPANVVIGSRFVSDGGFKSSAARRGGIRLISNVIKLLYGVSISDPTSGLRLMDRQAMKLFHRAYPPDYPEPISIAYALNARLTVQEVGVTMRGRQHGSSSISGLKTLSYMIRVVAYLLFARLGRRTPE